VGACLNHRYEADDAVHGRREGWIMSLSTLPQWRGRGIASALIERSLHTFAGAGLTHAAIGVDGDSPTGAARLYRSLGFEPLRRSITSQIEVASAS
jgi:ribosomal protein S18 acetylase RimI-like enzyme